MNKKLSSFLVAFSILVIFSIWYSRSTDSKSQNYSLQNSIEKEKSSHLDIEIIEGKIDGNSYYIPKTYFKIKGRYFVDNNIHLQTMFPDFLPLQKPSLEYWQEGIWWKNIGILAKHYENPAPIDILAKSQIDYLKTFEVVGEEHGLIHQTQPDGYVKDKQDIWLQKKDGQIVSFITCSESLIEKDAPQCTHHYKYRKFQVRLDYDKRLLSEWQVIHNNIQLMLESFDSSESSEALLRNKIHTSKAITEERNIQ